MTVSPRVLAGALAVVLAAGLAMVACASEEPAPVGDGQVLGQQASYGRDDPGAGPACFVARDAQAVERLWVLAVAGNVVGEAPVPPPSFRPPVVGVFLGQRPNGGYRVAFGAVERSDEGAMTLDVVVDEPAPGDVTVTVITSPYALYVLPSDAGPVVLTGDLDVDCQDRVPEVPAVGDPGRVEEEGA